MGAAREAGLDTSKIGNARQQDDNLKAVPDAKPLGDCCQELIGLIEKELIEPGEKDARMAQFYGGLPSLDSQHGQEWLNRTLALESATLAILEAIERGALTVWYVEHSQPTPLAPVALESGNVRYGVFKTHQHPEPEMQGAKLWVKAHDWRQFLATFALGKRSDIESVHFRVGHTFTRNDPATIAPWWNVNQSLAWIVTRIPSYVEHIGNLESVEPREGDLLSVVGRVTHSEVKSFMNRRTRKLSFRVEVRVPWQCVGIPKLTPQARP